MDYNDKPRSIIGGATKTSSPRVRRFQEHWKEQYPWVFYDEGQGKMFCRTCRDHADVCDPASAYFSGGCSNFQLMSLASHAKSKGHLTAEEVVRMQEYSSDVIAWSEKPDMTSSSCSAQASSSGISSHLYRRSSDVCSSGVVSVGEGLRGEEGEMNPDSVVSSFNIGSSEERIRLLRMAAEEAWRSVGPGSYNVPFNLDFSQVYDQEARIQSAETKRRAVPAIHHAFNTQMKIKTSQKVESVSPQSSNIPVGYPHTVQSPFAGSAPQKLNNLCLNAHAVAKKGLAYKDYKWMFQMDKAKGLDVGDSSSIREYQNLQRCISETILFDIVEAVRRSKFMSVFCDRISCVSSDMVVIYVKTVHCGKTCVHILSVEPLKDTLDSLTTIISSAFNQELKDLDFDWRERFVGFSSSDSKELIQLENKVEGGTIRTETCAAEEQSATYFDGFAKKVLKAHSSDTDRSAENDSRTNFADNLSTDNPPGVYDCKEVDCRGDISRGDDDTCSISGRDAFVEDTSKEDYSSKGHSHGGNTVLAADCNEKLSGNDASLGDDLTRFLRTTTPQIVSLHCSAHAVNTACRDLALDYHKVFEKVITCCCSISHHSPSSASSSDEDDRRGSSLECPRPSQIDEIQWISGTLQNARFVIKSFSSIVGKLKQVSQFYFIF